MKGLKTFLAMTRPFDWVIVLGLLVVCLAPYVVFTRQQAQENAAAPKTVLTAVVSHDGQVVRRIQLTGHTGTTTYRYRDGAAENVIVATGAAIAIVEANCPDQVCIRTGTIQAAGQTIVCLPHKLLVEITSSTGDQSGGMVTQ